MAKVIRIAMSGPDAVVDSCLDAFVRLHGWTEGEQSKEEKAREVLFAYILDSVKFYNRQQAEAAAVAAAHAAVEQLVPLTTLTLQVETDEPPTEEPPEEEQPDEEPPGDEPSDEEPSDEEPSEES